MKNSQDLWKRLPTAAELLENPRVRGMVDRLNPTVVTARVRGFLDEVRTEVSQRADDAGLPTLSELADRVGRYLTGGGDRHGASAINATGALRGRPWLSLPLAESALEQMLLCAQDYTLQTDGEQGSPLDDAVAQLRQLTGAEAATVLHSHTAALQLAMRSLPEPRTVVIARGEVATLEPGRRVTDLASDAQTALQEVGAADSVTLDDYRAALGAGAPLLRLAIDRSGDPLCRPPLAEVMGVAQQQAAGAIVELDAAPLTDFPSEGELLSPSVCEAVRLGADLVLVRGDGLIGGPACGIVLGKQDAVDRLTRDSLAASLQLDTPRAAALAATLRVHEHPDRAPLVVPALALVTTPLENLRTRAERLAPQIAATAGVREAVAVELPIDNLAGVPWRGSSWAVRIVPGGKSVTELAASLRDRTPAVVGVVQGEALLMNLRTVFPRQDLALLDAFEEKQPDAAAGGANDAGPDDAPT